MSEQRFKLQHINDLTDQEYMRLKKITDNGELITLGEVVDLLNEQQATINILLEELINAQNQGYVVGFLHKNGRCNLIPKEFEDE